MTARHSGATAHDPRWPHRSPPTCVPDAASCPRRTTHRVPPVIRKLQSKQNSTTPASYRRPRSRRKRSHGTSARRSAGKLYRRRQPTNRPAATIPIAETPEQAVQSNLVYRRSLPSRPRQLASCHATSYKPPDSGFAPSGAPRNDGGTKRQKRNTSSAGRKAGSRARRGTHWHRGRRSTAVRSSSC